MPIEHFTPEQIEEMREQFADVPVQMGAAFTEGLDSFMSECSTAAIQQIARARIRVLSLAAFMACWQRGATA